MPKLRRTEVESCSLNWAQFGTESTQDARRCASTPTGEEGRRRRHDERRSRWRLRRGKERRSRRQWARLESVRVISRSEPDGDRGGVMSAAVSVAPLRPESVYPSSFFPLSPLPPFPPSPPTPTATLGPAPVSFPVPVALSAELVLAGVVGRDAVGVLLNAKRAFGLLALLASIRASRSRISRSYFFWSYPGNWACADMKACRSVRRDWAAEAGEEAEMAASTSAC